MMEPAEYSRRVLIAVSGMSPQIVTETLYALAMRADNPFIPTEVHIVTTKEGANYAELNLLKKNKIGWFNILCQELNLPDIEFDVANIHIIRNEKTGELLDDIRTPQENELAAGYITEFIRKQSRDQNAALHVSIAGGRKTMGYYMGYALSLFGRPQDRLSHVLVSQDYEGNPEFYYPTKAGNIIYDIKNNNKPLDPARAEVVLADIPFLRINNDEAKNTMNGFSFRETIQATQEVLKPARLEIDYQQQLLRANGHLVKLQDQQFAFYCWIIERQEAGKPVKTPANTSETFGNSVEFMDFYEKIKGAMGAIEKTEKVMAKGMKAKYIQETVSKIKSEITRQLGSIASEPFVIKGHGKPATYTTSVVPENICYEKIVTTQQN